MRWVQIRNSSHPLKSSLVAGYCDSFLCKLRGLALRPDLPSGESLLLVEGGQSRLGTGIHMFAMAFDLSVAWLDADLKVVDVRHARRWRSLFVPRKPARYVLEFHVSRFEEFHVDDQIVLEEVPAA